MILVASRRGLRVALRRVGIGLGVGALLFLGAPPSAFAGSCDGAAAVECATLTNLLAGGSESGAAVVVPAATIAEVEAAMAPVLSGTISATTAQLLGTAGTLALGLGGTAAWRWVTSGSDLPAGTDTTGLGAFAGPYTISPTALDTVAVAKTDYVNFTVTNPVGTYRHGWLLCRTAAGEVPTPAALLAAVTTYGASGTTAVAARFTGWSNAGGNIASASSGATFNYSFNSCGTLYQPAAIVFWTNATSSQAAIASMSQVGVLVVGYQGVATPGGAFPGRTIEQVVTCKMPNGQTYNRAGSVDAAMALSGLAYLTVAGLMCDPGDVAIDYGATVKTPGQSDVPIVRPSSAGGTRTPTPGLSRLPSDLLSDLVKPGSTHKIEFLPGSNVDPSQPPVIRPATPDPAGTSPGVTDPGTGATSYCGMSFADVLTGAVMFKASGCALSWAFVPSAAAVATTTATLRSSFDHSGVSTYVSSFGAVPGALSSAAASAGTGCAGPHFTIPLKGHSYSFDPLNACSAPMSGVAVVIKVLISVLVIVAGLRFLLRPVLSSFGLGEAVK
ncbi:MAG: hypothetical protein WCI74_06220 [Actinomycetes bacterium]